MNSKDSSYGAGHRERIRAKFLVGKLMDYELVELLLTYAIPRCDVKPIARDLLKTFGGVHQIVSAPIEDLTKIKGIKNNAAIAIKLIHEIMVLGYKNQMESAPIFHNFQKVSDYCKLLLSGKSVEEFHVLYLDADYKLLMDELHSVGTIDWTAVYPRELLKRALNLNAHSVVLMHNHPIPNKSFSNQDIEITGEIKRTLETVGIKLYDHLLVSGTLVYSANNMFLIK